MLAATLHLVACMAVFSMLERLWPSSSPHKWWRRPLLIDLCSWLILPLAVGAGITLAVLTTGALVARGHRWDWFVQAQTVVGVVPLFIQILVAFISVDFISYWIHRAYHRFPFLWSFHVMHHTSEKVDWLSTLRLHPLSQMIDTALTSGTLLMAGFSLKAVIVANAVIGFCAVVAHANVSWTFGPFRHVFVSPLFHHWHHARHQGDSDSGRARNFGAALSIWDRIFGTSIHANTRPTRFGAEDAPVQNLWNLIFQPLRFCLRGKQRKPEALAARPSSRRSKQRFI